MQICIDLDIWMNKLTNFQMTRFANSVHFVFLNLRNDYLAVQLALVYLIACKENRSRVEEPKCVIRKINFGCFVWAFHAVLTSIRHMVSFLTSARTLTVSNMSGWMKFKMSSQYFWRWWKPWIILTVPKNAYGSDIMLIYWTSKNGKSKNIHGFWSQVHKHWYVKADETSFCGCPTFCSISNWHGEGEIFYFKFEVSQWFIKWGFWWRYKRSDRKLQSNFWFEVFAGEDVSKRKCHGWVGRDQKIFLNTMRSITRSLATVNDGDLMNYHRKPCQKFDCSISDSKEIIQSILKKENITLFSNAKVIIYLICVACVKFSVESVV